jgi:hypothetical protein
MAHFAELDKANTVLRVLVIADSDCIDENGIEVESIGADYCNSLFGGHWVQTSYNNRIRKQFASIGDRYDSTVDVFIRPQPFPSWSLDENYDWQPPTGYPTENDFFIWSETNREWVKP